MPTQQRTERQDQTDDTLDQEVDEQNQGDEQGGEEQGEAPLEDEGKLNFTMIRKTSHPNGRTSYIVPGMTGNLVIFDHLFADGVPPETLTLDVPLASPMPDARTVKAEENARRLADRATKAAERAEATRKMLVERQAKATRAQQIAQGNRTAAANRGTAPGRPDGHGQDGGQ